MEEGQKPIWQHKLDYVDKLLEENPERYHKSSSPYFGLTVKEQAVLARMRRPKGRLPKSIKGQFYQGGRADLQKILYACCQTIIYGSDLMADQRLDRLYIDIKLHYKWRRHFKKPLLPGVVVAHHDWSVVVRANVDKVIGWLYQKGESPFTAKELRKYLFAIANEQDKVLWYTEYAAPQSIVECYGEIIQDGVAGKYGKSLKGRRHYRKSGNWKSKPKQTEV